MWEFLTDRQYPGGKSREVPRITLEATETGWRVVVTDYNLSVKLTHEFEHLSDFVNQLASCWLRKRGRWQATKSGEGYKRRKANEDSELAKRPDELYHLAKGGGDPKAKRT